MDKSISVINQLLVDIFYDILQIEQKSVQYHSFDDLSISEIHTIEAIGMYTPRKMTDVACQLDITLSTLTTAVNHLAQKKYVERSRSEIDRRIVYIMLTKKGKIVYRLHRKFHYDMIKECIEDLNEQERFIFIGALEKLNGFFKSKCNIGVKTK